MILLAATGSSLVRIHTCLHIVRRSAIDVPADSVAWFEVFFVIASELPGFHKVEGQYEAEWITSDISAESILILVESNWIQSKTVIGLIWFVLFIWLIWFI
jgi:hypothetical protein